MADKMKSAAVGAKFTKPKRPSTTSVATSSKTKVTPKEKVPATRKDLDTSILSKEPVLPDFDDEYRQFAYLRFMRATFEECMAEEKFEREETQMDLQMAQLAERFQKTMDQLDKTNRRLKEISFVVEQNRLCDLRNTDCEQVYQMNHNANAETLLKDFSDAERPVLDKIQLQNIDFGFNKNTGHKQLLDAVDDAIEGLANIKKESKLDPLKFEQYEHSKMSLEEMDSHLLDVESLKSEFNTMFPKYSEKLIQEVSEKIAKMLDDDNEVEDD